LSNWQRNAIVSCRAVKEKKMVMNTTNKKSGLTIVELIVVIGLSGLLGISVMRFFSAANITSKNLSQHAILQMESRKAFDHIIDQIREGIDVIRPASGETTQYLVFKDLINQITMLYLEPNDEESRRLKKRVYRLISYRTDYSGTYERSREKVLHNSIKRIRFTSLSPTSVQVSATVASENDEYQFMAHVGLLNTGGLD